MSTSGTTAQTFQLEDILTGAAEICGIVDPGESLDPHDRATLLKVLQLVAAEFHAKFGQRIWQHERTNRLYTTLGGTAATVVTSGTAAYYLDTDTEDIYPDTVFVRRSGDDNMLRALSQKDYSRITDKSTRTGKPEAYLLERNQNFTSSGQETVGRLRIVLYPTPDNSTDQIHHVRWRRTEDWGGGTANPDVPWKYCEAYTLALANKAGLRFGLSQQRHQRIRTEAALAEEIMRRDDHERGPARFGIDLSDYYQ